MASGAELMAEAERRLSAIAVSGATPNGSQAVCASLNAHQLWLAEAAGRVRRQHIAVVGAARMAGECAAPAIAPASGDMGPLDAIAALTATISTVETQMRTLAATLDAQTAQVRSDAQRMNQLAAARVATVATTQASTDWAAIEAALRAQAALAQRAAEEVEQGGKIVAQVEPARADVLRLRSAVRHARCKLDDATDMGQPQAAISELRGVVAQKQAELEAAEAALRALQSRSPPALPLAVRFIPQWAATLGGQGGEASALASGATPAAASRPACAICTHVYDEGERKPKMLQCGHSFCEACLVAHHSVGVAASGEGTQY